MARDLKLPRRPPGWIAPGPAPRGIDGRAELEPAADEEWSYLAGDWKILQKRRGHRWSLDDLVTAYVAIQGLDPTAPLRAIDLGCGLGSVLQLVAWALPRADVTGIEAQADRAAMGRRALAFNGIEDRARILDGDLRTWTPPACDLVTGTPPYFPRGTGTESALPHAMPCRFEERGGPEDYLAAAARTTASRVVICSSILQRDRIAAPGLHVVEHWDVIPREDKETLICVDVLERAPRPLARNILVVRDRAGVWTPAFRAVRTAFGMPCVA